MQRPSLSSVRFCIYKFYTSYAKHCLSQSVSTPRWEPRACARVVLGAGWLISRDAASIPAGHAAPGAFRLSPFAGGVRLVFHGDWSPQDAQLHNHVSTLRCP